MKFKEFLYIYAIGSIGYSFIEILWRGYTHWSMGIVGGICMVIMYMLEMKLEETSILKKAFVATVAVTVIEFITGIIVNKYLKLNVWDYSQMKINLLGQISLVYSIFWYVLCIPCLFLCRILRHRVFDVLNKNSSLSKIFER